MPPTVIYTLSLHDALPISAPGGPTPADAAPDPDAAKWASLAAELDKPETEEAAEEPSPPEPPQPEPIEPPADKPKPSYEQLETNYRNAQGAFTSERERARRAEESLTAVNKLID